MEINDVITINDQLKCLLLLKELYNNDTYFLSVILDENEQPIDDYLILKQIEEDGSLYVISETDNVILEALVTKWGNEFPKLLEVF